MSKSRNTRHQRVDPYLLDGWFVSFHRSTAGIAWRWRTELTLLAAISAAVWRLSLLLTFTWAAVLLGVLVLAVVAVPVTRRYTTSRFWCVLARHRLQRVCYETRLHTRAGRLPLVLWIRPTKVGVRAHILCRAGICADDFNDNAAEIAAACYARDARVTRNPKWSHLLTLDIIRHDTLAASQTVTSPLPGLSTRRARLQGHIDDPDLAGTRQ